MKPASRRGARRANARSTVKTAPVTNTAEAIVASPPRPDLRAPMREDDPRARAAARAADIKSHLGTLDEGEDRFFIDPKIIPDAWTYEWKRQSVLGKEDPAYQVHLQRTGWEAVPASRHPSYMPAGGAHATIERDGMVLMERPKEITDEARAIELRKARQQVRHKEDQLSAAKPGEFDRQKSDGSSLVKIGKSYELMPVPEG